jgi:hypothetical protein
MSMIQSKYSYSQSHPQSIAHYDLVDGFVVCILGYHHIVRI